MVEYVLKIDIDESALVRKLNAALKKVRMPGMATGTGGSGGAQNAFGMPMAGGMAHTQASLTDSGYKRISEAQQRDTILREGQHNIELFRFQNKKMLEDTRFQHSMVRIGKLQNNWSQKMFNVGSVVRLAGLATGVAGLLQMRKMVIESSPMLQSMLKILNVGVMLYLRPIGDFIGFVLRPLLVPFLISAAKWYGQNVGDVVRIATTIGTGAQEGDIVKTAGGISEVIGLVAGFFSPQHWAQEAAKSLSGWLSTAGTISLNILPAAYACPSASTYAPCGKEYYGPGGAGGNTGSLEDLDPDTRTPGTPPKHLRIKLTETIALADAKVRSWITRDWAAERERSMIGSDRVYDTAASLTLKGVCQEAGTGFGYCQYAKSGGIVTSPEEMQKARDLVEKREEERAVIEEGTAAWFMANHNLSVANDSLARMDTALRYNTGEVDNAAAAASRFATALAKIQGTGIGGVAGGIGGGGGGYTGGSPYQAQHDYVAGLLAVGQMCPNPYSPTGCSGDLAHGGLITEEIWGVGKDTGKHYKLGEEGDEMVIPWEGNMQSSLRQITGGGPQGGGAVGEFQGVSNVKYQRAAQMLRAARERIKGMSNPNYLRGGPGTNLGNRGQWGPMQARYERAGQAIAKKRKAFASAKGDISSLEGIMGDYQQATGYTSEQMAGATTNQVTASPTNNNSITINVSGVDSADDTIAKIGPALLKFMEENEARVGIR